MMKKKHTGKLIKNSKSFFESNKILDFYKKKKIKELKSKNPLQNYFFGIKKNSDNPNTSKKSFKGFMKKCIKNSFGDINIKNKNKKRKSCRININTKKSMFDKKITFSKSKEILSSRKISTKANTIINKKIKKIDFTKIFKIENYLFEFTDLIYNNKDIYDIFKDYIDFVQENKFSFFLKLIENDKMRENFKISFILERAIMMIIFYITINDKNNEDIIFLHKALVRVYSNIYIFITFLIDKYFDDNLIDQNQKYLDIILHRKFKNYKITIFKNIEKNNKKLLSYIDFLLQSFNSNFSNKILKLKEFIEDLSLEEGLNFLIKIFNKAYQEKGVTKKEDSNKKNKIEDEKKIKTEISTNKKNIKKKKYTLVLDLDETLIHYSDVEEDGKVNFRPHLDKFFSEIMKHYEIIIFTASRKDYADTILDYLDPENEIFIERYYREDLKEGDNCFIKDLDILKRDISKIIIIDNLPDNFKKQKDNGIFINSWYNDSKDVALLNLIPVLFEIVEKEVEDVRLFLKSFKERMIENIQKGSVDPGFALKQF